MNRRPPDAIDWVVTWVIVGAVGVMFLAVIAWGVITLVLGLDIA